MTFLLILAIIIMWPCQTVKIIGMALVAFLCPLIFLFIVAISVAKELAKLCK